VSFSTHSVSSAGQTNGSSAGRPTKNWQKTSGSRSSPLKKAARALEEAGYISRTIRPDQSNKFFINMGKIQAEALANRKADAEALIYGGIGQISTIAKVNGVSRCGKTSVK
jgi:hypothetical protein